MTKELKVFAKWEDFLKWLLNVTEKFPKKIRFSFTTRIDNLALDILEKIISCKYNPDLRQRGLKNINLDLEKLRVLLRICNEMHYMPHRQYQSAVIGINETGRMLWGWLKEKDHQ